MAKVKIVTSDTSSAEIDELRLTVNSLVNQLATLNSTDVTDAGSLLAAAQAIGDAATAGTNGLVGQRVTNRHPRRPGSASAARVVEMEANKDL